LKGEGIAFTRNPRNSGFLSRNEARVKVVKVIGEVVKAMSFTPLGQDHVHGHVIAGRQPLQ